MKVLELKLVGGGEAELPIRYCFLDLSKIFPCLVGWGVMDDNSLRSCIDDPKEKNCRYLIDDVERIPVFKIILKARGIEN